MREKIVMGLVAAAQLGLQPVLTIHGLSVITAVCFEKEER